MADGPVDFFIVGAMKSGTTSLRALLGRSPDVNVCRSELHFFDNDAIFANGLDWYHGQFEPSPPGVLKGDKSPSYGLAPRAAERIEAYNPAAKIVWIFRDPVERAISNFYHAKKRKLDAPDIDFAIERRDALEARNAPTAYVYRSQYEKHLAPFDRFGPEQSHVIIFEEALAGGPAVTRGAFDFLGVRPPERMRFPHANEGVSELRDQFPVGEETIRRLKELLAPTIEAIEARLGRRIEAWRG